MTHSKRNPRIGQSTTGPEAVTKPAVAAPPREVTLIERSGEFDLDHYQSQAGQAFTLGEAVAHYVAQGERTGFAPSPDFEPAFYLATNPDVDAAGVNAFGHFLKSGRSERRYPSRAALAEYAQIVTEAGAFDAEYYRRVYPAVDFQKVRPLDHYLTIGCRRGLRPSADFDGEFYEQSYPDVRASDSAPLIHWIKYGKDRGYVTCYEQVAADVDLVRSSPYFDARYYLTANDLTEGEVEVDAAVHYAVHGAPGWLNPGPLFSTEYYLRRYPDLRAAGVNPLAHYEKYGKAEGRKGLPPAYRTVFHRGRARYHHDRPNLMMLIHEASRTGAPLLGLALVQEYAQRYNVFVWAGREGVLGEDLEDTAALVGYGYSDPLDCEFVLRDLLVEYAVDAVIANSVETAQVHAGILACDIPSVGLIHEFANYSRPVGKITDVISRLDRCLVPADIVKRSALDEIQLICGSTANNVVVRPQGHLPESLWSSEFAVDDDDGGMREQMERRFEGKRIVLGAGFVHIRKGLDLFVETARWVRELSPEPVHFLWIGDGWGPKSDFNYGLWVQDSLERWGLEDDVTIIGAQNTIDWAFELADVFLLSSRLDPFPNVAVDAMAAAVPVVCFDETTGIAEFVSRTGAAGAVVPYLDTRAAAEAIVGQLTTPGDGSRNQAIIDEHLDFLDYARAIESEIELAKASAARRRESVAELEAANCFDRGYHDQAWKAFPDDRAALQTYVARSMKGIYRYSPLPGFSDSRFASAIGLGADGEVPLLRALQDAPTTPPRTHDCVLVDPTSPEVTRTTPRVALHLHLFYPELAADVVQMLEASGIAADLFISCRSELHAKQIDLEMHAYSRGDVAVRVVPNAGRDIGPFVTEFGRELLDGGYDIVGHLHGKRSVGIGTGDVWRDYLWGSLLGGEGVWPAVKKAFEDPKLGLLFPEDRHVVGWSKNRPFGEGLRTRLGLSVALPDSLVFPIGTMFWARPEALRPLLGSGLDWSDYPSEPLPYDGSVLHAIERMLPTICEETGHRWKTIYVPGTTW